MNKYAVGIILGLLGAGINFQAQAAQILEQAPVIFEYNLAGPVVIESELITATGIIKTISVSAESVGQVSLEASANGGIAYTKIINGAPLTDGFIPGNQLRFRINIGLESSLKKLIIGYTDSSGVARLYRNPDLANYKYHQEIHISGGSQEVFNYPLYLKLDSRFRGDDKSLAREGIYFTAADGQTPLYYYLEDEIASSPAAPRNDTGSVATSNDTSAAAPRNDKSYVIANPPKAGEAIYWINVPQIPKEGTRIYMYYNNVTISPEGVKQSQKEIASSPQPAASAAKQAPRNDNCQYNDPTKVFPFFDDFNGTILNEEKWEIIPGLKKECSVKDGYLQLKDCLVITRNFKIKQAILEFKAKAQENAGIQVVVRAKVSAQGLFPYEQIVYSSNYPGAEHAIAINDIAKLNVSRPIQPLTDYMYKATLNSTGIFFERYSANQQEKQAQIKFLDMESLDQSGIGLKSEATVFNAGSIYFDWIRVRPYVEVEPQIEEIR